MNPSQLLKAWRIKHAPAGKKALSQEQAAKRIGVSGTAWCEWENGNKVPDIEKALSLEKLVGTRVKDWAAAAAAKSKARQLRLKKAG